MFSSNQAALLFFQLLGMHRVFGGDLSVQQSRTVEVFRGEPVELDCNLSTTNRKQFSWMKDKVLIFSIHKNETFYNLSSPRQIIHQDSFTRLSILNAQAEDEGLYLCSVSWQRGLYSIEWNVTVTEEDSWKFLIIVTVGFPFCCLILTVCLYRKCKTRTTNQDPVRDQSQPQSAEVADLTRPQTHTGQRTNNNRWSQYFERHNSIYDHI
ncbi:vascular endothelial growth factor receptor 3-like [Salarias fasciatus]|uniref:vascular endothelial growth factor receptor 3-like n=1 Tax=Salarias fasciatus TaxID=181472 RepID=UPI001176C1FF|nr:vascular endothelial growth factor receptor 3-like [Salarias fasciatus]